MHSRQQAHLSAPPTKGRVLVVDDEPALRQAYSRMLRHAGFVVAEASNGREAIAAIREADLDVIVSDINMPEVDGIELLRRVRASNLDIPVILVTGQPAIKTAVRAVELGALRYLEKPVDGETLVESVLSASRLHEMARLKRQALALHGDSSMLPGDRSGLEAILNQALASLWMAYQPIVSWSGRSLYAYEALLRTAEGPYSRPDIVLEVSERLGRLHDLGRATRAQVAAQVPEVPAQCMFVNLHPHDLLDPTLYDPASPLSRVAEKVILEVTERATLDRVKDVREKVAKLRALGFRIAIDDLGAGYAGLTSFAQLEPDIVKLDMSLVRDVHRHDVKRRIITSMTRLCQEMNLQVVAEGVETAEERDTIVACGCDLLQGYLLARPGKAFPEVSWGA
jgi:EAL domain-containing protein (putative c-di-GMP-specific phosphodiesterase class I)/ActR/RegA family two-component response regulator